MKRYILILLITFLSHPIKAQVDHQKLYSMTGLGFSFPVGETADYFKPKFSTSIGINLATGNKGFFIYPKLSLHAYSYNQLLAENNNPYALQKARATTYLLNLALGYRKTSGKFSYYFFAGSGGGLILLPSARVAQHSSTVILSNKSKSMFIVETGMGLAYNIGDADLFIEPSYMLGFGKIQDRNFNTFPLAVGIKPNLSKLWNKITRN